MKSMLELNMTPIEMKNGKIVVPEGYTIAPKSEGTFAGLAGRPDDVWCFAEHWDGDSSTMLYIVPDPSYFASKSPSNKEEDVVLEAFTTTIKELEEELQDVRKAAEIYIRLSQDAAAFARIADKYGWFDEDETEEEGG